MNLSTRRLGRLTAATAGGALVTSGLLLAAPAAQAATTHFVRADQVDQSETRAKGHNDFTANGVHVTTDASDCTDPNPAGGVYCANKAAGYFLVNTKLADVGEPSMLWTSTNPVQPGDLKPSVQLKTDFDGDGDVDGILVGEPTWADGTTLYGNDWWLSGGSAQFVKDAAPSHDGGSGSANHGTLNQWRATFPNAKVIESGWSLGSGVRGDGTISRISLGDDRYYFDVAGAPVARTIYRSQVNLSETRTKGHNDFLPGGGVHVYTDAADSQSKAAGYFDTDFPLSDAAYKGALDLVNNTPSDAVPGAQFIVDFDNDGQYDGTLVAEPIVPVWWLAGSKLVGGPVPAWLKDQAPRKPNEGGTPGYAAGGGTPAEWEAAFPAARIVKVGWSLGSGAKGDVNLNKITVGLHEFTFAANRAPVASKLAATTTSGGTVQVTLAASDADGDTLTYASADGTVAGNKLTYAAPKDFSGTKVLTYRATDPGGLSDTGTVTVTVNKASSTTTLAVSPGKISTKSKHVRAKITVTSAGAVVGGTVDLFDGTTKIGTGIVDANGTVKIAVTSKLAKGKHTIKAVFAGTTGSATSDASVVIKVKKAPKK
jgi:Bacterial Ig domain/Bacterial Ig-like domain (group 3)